MVCLDYTTVKKKKLLAKYCLRTGYMLVLHNMQVAYCIIVIACCQSGPQMRSVFPPAVKMAFPVVIKRMSKSYGGKFRGHWNHLSVLDKVSEPWNVFNTKPFTSSSKRKGKSRESAAPVSFTLNTRLNMPHCFQHCVVSTFFCFPPPRLSECTLKRKNTVTAF